MELKWLKFDREWNDGLNLRPGVMELKWLKFDREWNDGLNLRPGGATRAKRSIFRWERWGDICGYSKLQCGSPHLCRLRTIRSGPLNEHLIMY
jgi:hypothetical protein